MLVPAAGSCLHIDTSVRMGGSCLVWPLSSPFLQSQELHIHFIYISEEGDCVRLYMREKLTGNWAGHRVDQRDREWEEKGGGKGGNRERLICVSVAKIRRETYICPERRIRFGAPRE